MPEDREIQSEEDHSEALAEISEDLFGQESEKEGEPSADRAEGTPEVDSAAAKVENPPSASEDNSAEVQAVGAPKTWTKEALAEWATLSPKIQQEVLKREEDFLRGITQYKTAAEIGQRYNSVIEPFAAELQAQNVDPVQLFQSFAANHYTLSKGTPEQKAVLAAGLLDAYNIDLTMLAERLTSTPTQDPRITTLEEQVQSLSAALNQDRTAQQKAVVDSLAKEVEAFASDPAHPFFDELIDDIEKFIQMGDSLPQAYDKAVYANPQTRQKEIDRLTAEALAAQKSELSLRGDKKARSMAVNLESSPKSRSGTIPIGSMDDTLEATLAAIQSRG